MWQEARAGAGMCRGRLWMRWYLPEDDALGVCESDPPRLQRTGLALPQGRLDELQTLHLPRFAPHLTGGVSREYPALGPSAPGPFGQPWIAQGCLGLSGMESPFLVGNPELRAALRAGEELCDTARTRVLPSPSRSEPGLPFPTGNNERDASHLPADVCGCSSSSQAWRGGSTGSSAPAETLSILCEPRGAERSRFQ